MFRALQMVQTEAGVFPQLVELSESSLEPAEVTVAIEYSSLNYKDALALTNRSPIIRKFPLIPGIDLAGTVVTSQNTAFKQGDRVVANGWGLGEKYNGGFAELARVPASWLIPLPDHLSTRQAAAIGTAGYTAMLSVLALEEQGLTPTQGEIVVTGASGGVGSLSVLLLSQLGYSVVAVTGRPHGAELLRSLGAREVLAREDLAESAKKPLSSERWAGGIEVAGGATLAQVLSQARYGGVVTCCGLAQSSELLTTVFPFILRGVKLVGIDSVRAPRDRRILAWQRLARDLDFVKLETLLTQTSLEEAPQVAQRLLAGEVRGRCVVATKF